MRRSWLRLFWLIVVLVGAVAGYLVSSGLGTRLLHLEIETQLTRLLKGPVEIGEVEVHWEAGLRVEAREVEAYPSALASLPPALRARRVLASVDSLSLLAGRIELSALTLEGPHLRLARNPDGSWDGLPIDPVDPQTIADHSSPFGGEAFFVQLAALEGTAESALNGFRLADRIEVIDGAITWQDMPDLAPDPGGVAAGATAFPETETFRVELIEGVAEREWLSDAITLHWKGVFLDGKHAPFPFAIEVARKEDQPFQWSMALEKIPLGAAETPLAFLGRIEGLEGRLNVRLELETISAGRHRLSIHGEIDDAKIELSRTKTILEQDRAEVHSEIVFDDKRVRLSSGRLAGKRFGLDLKGVIERPIREGSPTRIESRVRGILLEDLRGYAQSLEGESETALTVSRLTERVQSGQIRYIEASGQAALSRWQDLFSGRVRELPDGFVLGGAFDEVTVLSGAADRLENLSAEVEWVEDQIIFRDVNAAFRGAPLPEMNLVINGASHLVRTTESARRITKTPPPIPGLGPLSEILKPRNPDALPVIKALGLAIDDLEHPIFRWPLRDLRVLVEPLRRGVEITVREGTWGGAPVEGEVVWFDDPVSPSVSATLSLAAPKQTEPGGPRETGPPGRWASGRLEMEFRPRPRLPFKSGTGFFRLEDTDLIGDELKIQVDDQGTIDARMTIGLETVESVGFDVTFALTEGRLAAVGPFVALPSDLATGAIGATGALSGRIAPNQPFVAELDGRVRAEASRGRVFTNLPLMFRLAKATEGFNPFANQNELEYETMTGSFALNHGLLSVTDFEIEGPLRVYARADMDTNQQPSTIRAVVGIFMFRKSTQILDSLPLLRSFLPGSERGLIGTYFNVKGPINAPDVEALPLQTLMSGVPSAIKAPFKALRFLFDLDRGKDAS